jgi:hypothetical protein
VFFVIAGSLFAIPIFSAVTMGLEVALKWWIEERPAEAENLEKASGELRRNIQLMRNDQLRGSSQREKNRGLRRKCRLTWIDQLV